MTEHTLTAYGPEHDAATVRWLNSGELRATFGFRGTVTLDSHRHWLDSTKDIRIWAVIDGKGQHCGNTLLHVNLRHRSGYFQIYLGEPSVRGEGLGKRALRETLAQAFEVEGLHRVWLHTFADNTAAEALYRRQGFVLEGIEREAIHLDNGIFLSQNRWSLLIQEWRNLEGIAA